MVPVRGLRRPRHLLVKPHENPVRVKRRGLADLRRQAVSGPDGHVADCLAVDGYGRRGEAGKGLVFHKGDGAGAAQGRLWQVDRVGRAVAADVRDVDRRRGRQRASAQRVELLRRRGIELGGVRHQPLAGHRRAGRPAVKLHPDILVGADPLRARLERRRVIVGDTRHGNAVRELEVRRLEPPHGAAVNLYGVRHALLGRRGQPDEYLPGRALVDLHVCAIDPPCADIEQLYGLAKPYGYEAGRRELHRGRRQRRRARRRIGRRGPYPAGGQRHAAGQNRGAGHGV